MFVNDVLFFNTYSHDINFVASRQQDKNNDINMQAMNSIKAYYTNMGFKIVELRADQQFEPAQAALADMEI